MPAPDSPERSVAGARTATERLLLTVDGLDESSVNQPSLLPGWTVGMVLTHLARNADSHVRLFRAALSGKAVNRYPGGAVQRTREIEAGRLRSLSTVAVDLRTAAATLDSVWQEVLDAPHAADVWDIVGRAIDRDEPVRRLPWLRWREVEVHHADLGIDTFAYDDWSTEYVRRELRLAEMAWRASHSMGMTPLPGAALSLPPHRRLAWLLGRTTIDGLPAVSQWW
jgi:maleylpyruvate isomerase